MRRLAMVTVLGLACSGAVLPAQAAEDGGSIASKVDVLGDLGALSVADLRASRRNNLLRVQATITNSSSRKMDFQYRFRWLDADGFVVGEPGVWRPEIIAGNGDKVINAGALDFKAADFKLELKDPNAKAASYRNGSTADNPPYR